MHSIADIDWPAFFAARVDRYWLNYVCTVGQGRTMREYLLQFMNEDAAMGVQFLIALIAVLILFGIFVWFLRLITGTQYKRSSVRQDQRLAVLDRTSVDDSRSLLLVQRDGIEHLLMVGGPSDVVVESNINLSGPASSAENQPKPGHEIARRVIAQRPFRTMSLAGSSATVAESMGIVTSDAPETAIATPSVAAIPAESIASVEPTAPQNEVRPESTQEAVTPPQAAEAIAPLPVSDVAVKKIAEIISEPTQIDIPTQAPSTNVAAATAQPIEHSAQAISLTLAEEPAQVTAPAQAVSLPVAPSPVVPALVDPVPLATASASTVPPASIAQAPAASAPEQTVTQQQTPVQKPIAHIQPETQKPQYSNVSDQDLLANLEDALKIDVPPTTAADVPQNVQTEIPAAGNPSLETAADQNLISRRQDIDLTSGFAAAMANSQPEQQMADNAPTISENFLEDALASALEVSHDTYADDKNTVYSSSESVPAGSEGRSTLRRTSHVDDEMNRLLDELATPNRG